jgi:hypothetical protein
LYGFGNADNPHSHKPLEQMVLLPPPVNSKVPIPIVKNDNFSITNSKREDTLSRDLKKLYVKELFVMNVVKQK